METFPEKNFEWPKNSLCNLQKNAGTFIHIFFGQKQ